MFITQQECWSNGVLELGLLVANWVITLIVSVHTVESSVTQESFDNSRLGFSNPEPWSPTAPPKAGKP